MTYITLEAKMVSLSYTQWDLNLGHLDPQPNVPPLCHCLGKRKTKKSDDNLNINDIQSIFGRNIFFELKLNEKAAKQNQC